MLFFVLYSVTYIISIDEKMSYYIEKDKKQKKEIATMQSVIRNLEAYLPGIGISDAVNEIIQKSLNDESIDISKLTMAMMSEKNKIMLELHGLQNYNMRFAGLVFPVRYPERSYVACPEAEFGIRNLRWKNKLDYHKGFDIFSIDDTDVMACGDGVVVWVGKSIVGGNAVIVRHFIDGEYIDSYVGHLFSYCVEKNQRVKRGDMIGISGATGTEVDGRHVHFELRRYSADKTISINPATNSTWMKRVDIDR